MIHLKTLLFSILALTIFFTSTLAFNVSHFYAKNNCPYVVWATSVPGVSVEMNPEDRTFLANSGSSTPEGRIWARTGCKPLEKGNTLACETGDCNGIFQCDEFGSAPYTQVEYAFNQFTNTTLNHQFNNLDFIDISLTKGFNIPISVRPISGDCTKGAVCKADITSHCPGPLKSLGGCLDPCTKFQEEKYCCANIKNKCKPTHHSTFFKDLCPDARTRPKDHDATFTCPTYTDYEIVFCP